MPIDLQRAAELLAETFNEAQTAFQENKPPELSLAIKKHLDTLFMSNTQAFREVLIGTVLARLEDKMIDLHLPYVKHGKNAYHARELDERVVNPFLKDEQIPSSKGPFLNVFRRGVKFTKATKTGLRDKTSFDSLLKMIDYIGSLSSDGDLRAILKCLLYAFIRLRETSRIEIARVQRLSVPQYDALVEILLKTPSGGRFPVFLVVATLRALKTALDLDWEIRYQGINVADAASEEPGDITIARKGNLLMAAEVTERVVDKARVISTFTSKIAPAGVGDYVFFVKFRAADPEAMKQAQQYFAQGHDVNFLDIKTWVLNTLSTIGSKGRAVFNVEMAKLLDGDEVPRRMKVVWNQQIQALTSV